MTSQQKKLNQKKVLHTTPNMSLEEKNHRALFPFHSHRFIYQIE